MEYVVPVNSERTNKTANQVLAMKNVSHVLRENALHSNYMMYSSALTSSR